MRSFNFTLGIRYFILKIRVSRLVVNYFSDASASIRVDVAYRDSRSNNIFDVLLEIVHQSVIVIKIYSGLNARDEFACRTTFATGKIKKILYTVRETSSKTSSLHE